MFLYNFRFFVFNEESKELSPLCESEFHNHCVLKITQSFIEMENHKHSIFLSGGTDGRIALWDISNILSLKTKSKNCCNSSSCLNSDSDSSLVLNSNLDTKLPAEGMCSNVNYGPLDRDQSPPDNSSENLTSICPGSVGPLEPVITVQCHQSGVNAISTLSILGMSI